VNVLGEKPTAAFVLALIAGILGLIVGIIYAIAAAVIGAGLIGAGAAVMPGMAGLGGIVMILGFWWLIASILIIVGAIWINSGDPGKVRNGGIMVLIFSILSLPNLLVFILGLIGGILALTWKPSKKKVTEAALPAPPPPPG